MSFRRALALACGLVATAARADVGLPPWSEPSDLPVPTWVQSAIPRGRDAALWKTPGVTDERRGAVADGVRLPVYAMKRGPKCAARWLLVGPQAWLCADAAELTSEAPLAPELATAADGLPYRYFFVGKQGASGFVDLARAGEAAPDEELDPGFAVAVTEERNVAAEAWGHTHHGAWVAMRELAAARPSGFHGEPLADRTLDLGWISVDRANVYSAPKSAGKPIAVRARREVVHVREERVTPAGVFVRLSDDGAAAEAWIARKDVVRPTLASPPPEVTGERERWIDVELSTQTLVAYEGARPVFATLVSTGRGPKGSPTATPPGAHRVWVKLRTSTMDNLPAARDVTTIDDRDPEERYSIEDVPYVQFFDGAVALHAAFWHDGFGAPRSHGCVNLAPRDAATLFDFTGPHLPAGWGAVLPTATEPGTVVRVR